MSKNSRAREKQARRAPSGGRARLMAVFAVAAVLVVALVWHARRERSADAAGVLLRPASTNKLPAMDGVKLPPFAIRAGMKPPFGIDLRGGREHAVALIEPGSGRRLAMPGWDDCGAFTGYTLDGSGNVFLVPSPFRRGAAARIDTYNKLYRIDGETGVLAEFVKLPVSGTGSPVGNPASTTGVTYDCATASLYVASVAGSGPVVEAGVIHQLDPATRTVVASYAGFDALGLAVFEGGRERRLYLASARRPEVHSIALDEKGGFVGEPRFEVSLLEQPGGADDRGLVLKFPRRGELEVRGGEFGFSLIHGNNTDRNIYTFIHQPENDSWRFKDITRKLAPQ